jgi:hypothetical protein
MGAAQILASEPGMQLPIDTGGKRNSVPEDCGGIGGYADLVGVMSHPNCPEYTEMIE